MQKETVRSILRIIAVTCVMIGVILILQSLIQLMMVGSLANPSIGGLSLNMQGVGAKMGFYLFLSQACISVAGLILYKFWEMLQFSLWANWEVPLQEWEYLSLICLPIYLLWIIRHS